MNPTPRQNKASQNRRLHSCGYRTTLTARKGYGFSRLAPKPSSAAHAVATSCDPVRSTDASRPYEHAFLGRGGDGPSC